LHSILELGVENYDKKGSTYRGTFRPYKFEHDFKELEEIALGIMKKSPHLFTENWKVETELNAETSKGNMLSGIVDTMTITGSSASLVDWKSGRTRQDKNEEIDMLQAIMYAFIVFKLHPYLTEVKFTYYYIDSDGEYLTLNFATSDLKNLEIIIEKYIAISKYRGLALNNSCKYCKNANTCPLVANKLKNVEDLDMSEIRALESVLKTRREEIKALWLKSDELKAKNFSTSRTYAVYKADLTVDQQLALLKDKITVTKKIKEKLELEGIEVIENKFLKMKPKAK
jgi:hypothetical protein